MEARHCENESQRLAELFEYQILDTPPEEEFDAITALAAGICDVPIAVVNFVAEGRQWFKAERGLGVKETPLDVSICAHVILEQELVVVEDLRADERFADNPLVSPESGLRFYAGALLIGREGNPLGTLCVLDTMPRSLSSQQRTALTTLASHVMSMLELKRSERLLQETTSRLVEALSTRKRVLATVAHDLRTPLSVISMGAKVLSESCLDHQTQVSVGRRITRATGSALRLVEDLLEHEEESAHSVVLKQNPIRLEEFLANVLDQMSALAVEANIELTIETSSHGAQILGDEARLEQVMMNLVGNALKFTPSGGKVTLSASTASDVVVIQVTDTGIGIPLDLQESIFEPYFRLNLDEVRGAGLGLSIVQRIVGAHGGSVTVKSEPEAGACFSVTLPLHQSP